MTDWRLQAVWTGEAFEPASRFWQGIADKNLVVGERYVLVEAKERSQRSHDHYFACMHEAWVNLPEEIAERFPTEDHLRKYALIKCGYRDERTLVVKSNAEAVRIAAFMRPVHEFALISIADNIIVEWTPKSQKIKAMGAKTFQESKDRVLMFVAELIGISIEELTRNAGKAA